jgi:hypothetical protein
MLPYASLIFWTKDSMHCFSNIIKDAIRVMKASCSVPGWKHFNRTEAKAVRISCMEHRIFRHLWIDRDGKRDPCRWGIKQIHQKNICDERLLWIRGLPRGEIPVKVMQHKGTKYSYKAIQWGTIYARWCLHGQGDTFVTESFLNLFKIIRMLQSFTFNEDKTIEIRNLLYEYLITLEGALPRNESRITRHEIVHVLESIPLIGPPRLANMYKYERVNLYCKQLIKNRYHPIPSIVKNLMVRDN